MKAAAFDYERPLTCEEASKRIAASEGAGKFVTGSQSLGPMMNLRLAQPELLVDLRGIPALRECRVEGEYAVIGACVTHAEIEDRRIDDVTQGLMPHVARGIAYRAVRNRGTLGGSLVHADPAADWISVMRGLDAEYLVTGPRHERVVTSDNWMPGAFTVALEADEILTAVRIRRLPKAARWSYYKFNRKPGEFAEAIALLVEDEQAGLCRAVIGAIDAPPYLIADAHALVADPDGPALDSSLIEAGLEADTYEYKVHRVALRRAVAMLTEQRRDPR